ncbi:MAG: hypothetical protein QOE20_4543 [Mycobacterium sp.]|nr:hypothetical protein [Mycobacterium sp.]
MHTPLTLRMDFQNAPLAPRQAEPHTEVETHIVAIITPTSASIATMPKKIGTTLGS